VGGNREGGNEKGGVQMDERKEMETTMTLFVIEVRERPKQPPKVAHT